MRTFLTVTALAAILSIAFAHFPFEDLPSDKEEIPNENDDCACPPPNNVCKGKDNGTAVDNPAECGAFYHCRDEKPIPADCPKGQWFNPITSWCDCEKPTEEGCEDNVDRETCPPTGVHFLPHPTNCSKFILCHTGRPSEHSCAKNLTFDETTGQCNTEDKADCKLTVCPEEDDPDNVIFLPSDSECDKFYICYKGEPLPFWCSNDTYWNDEIQACDFKENVNCTTEAEEDPCGEPFEIECPSKDNIEFIPHPTNCRCYFVCALGDLVLVPCADDLYFDTVNNWCDIPENSKCGSSNGTDDGNGEEEPCSDEAGEGGEGGEGGDKPGGGKPGGDKPVEEKPEEEKPEEDIPDDSGDCTCSCPQCFGNRRPSEESKWSAMLDGIITQSTAINGGSIGYIQTRKEKPQ